MIVPIYTEQELESIRQAQEEQRKQERAERIKRANDLAYGNRKQRRRRDAINRKKRAG